METSGETRDIVDSVRIEASSLSPHDAREARNTLGKMSRMLEDKFQGILPEAAIERASKARGNLVVVDDPDQYALSFFSKKTSQELLKGGSLHGIYHNTPVPLIVIIDQAGIWEDANPDEKEYAIQVFGDKEKAAQNYGRLISLSTLGHELAHAYIDPTIPDPVQELGAYYIGDLVSKEIFNEESPVEESELEAYRRLAQKFGDDFERYLFGGEIGRLANFRIPRELKALGLDSDETED